MYFDSDDGKKRKETHCALLAQLGDYSFCAICVPLLPESEGRANNLRGVVTNMGGLSVPLCDITRFLK